MGQGNPLFTLYARYVGEPGSRKDVYGYWTFLVGAVVGFVGVLLFISNPAGNLLAREAAIALSAFGMAVGALGIVLLLPVKHRSIQASVVGTAVALLAVGLFVTVYPDHWDTGTPSYSAEVISVYTAGMAVVVGVAALIPVLTGEKSLFFEEEYEREEEHPDVVVGEALRGGLFAVYRQTDEWQWRFVEQDAIVGAADGFLSRLETEEAVDHVREMIAEAGLMEIKNAAFRLYETDEGLWRWLLVREDGSVVADSGEAFDARDEAADSVNDLKDFGPDANVLDIEGAAFDLYTDGGRWRWRLVDEQRSRLLEGAGAHDDRADAVAALERVKGAADASTLVVEEFGVELFEDGEEWNWRLLDADDAEVATGSVGFGSRRTAESAVYDLLEALGSAPVIDADEPAYEVAETGGSWGWRLVDGDDRRVAESHGSLDGESAATAGAEAMGRHAGDADVVVIDDAEFEYYRTAAGWRWRLVTEDRTVLATGTDSHESSEAAAAAVDRVKTQAGEADLIEFENAAFQLYETDGEWRWRLIDEDGNVMADSGETHDSRDGAASSMITVKENAPDAELLEIETAAFELFEDDAGWNWRLVDEGGETTARGTGGLDSKAAAKEAMDRLVAHAGETGVREMRHAAFQLYAADDEWRWRFVLPDGSVVADGVDGHSTRDEVETAVDERVREVATDGDVHVVPAVAVKLVSRGERWSWRLVDPDRTTLGTASDAHEERGEARADVERLKRHADDAAVFELTGPAFRLVGHQGTWRWELVDADRTVLASGPHTHGDQADAEAALDRASALLPDAAILDYDEAAFELFEEDGRWHWRLIDADERVVAAGADGHASREAAREALEAVREEVGDAAILEIETAAFELHEGEEGWRWQLIDENGNVLAKSVAAAESRRDAREAMNTVKEFGPGSVTQVAE